MPSTLAGWLDPGRLVWPSQASLGLRAAGMCPPQARAWVEWARPRQAHLLCSGPLWSWLSWCSGNPTEGLVGRGPCLDSPSTGLLPLCWPEGPCSQKPGQTPQVQCAAAVPAPEREESAKGERGVHWAPGMGPPPFSRGLHSPVPGCQLSTILKMSAPPFLCPGAAAFHGGRVSISTGSACGVRYLGNQAQNWVIHDLGGPGGQEHGVWVRKGSWLCPSCCLTCGKSLKLNLWALAPSFVKRE